MKMFQYLNQRQVQDLMLLFCVGDTLEKIIKTWVEHENFTKEEAKYIRTSRTYFNKFVSAVQERIPDKEKEKLIKRYSDFHLQIMDKWLLSKFNDEITEKAQVVRMDRDIFTKFAYEIANVRCKDCDKSHTECDLHDVLYESLFSAAEQKKNCPYAFVSDEKRIEMQKEQELKELLKQEKKANKSKRARKKKANRFDEDDEVEYVYNFTPKGGAKSYESK